MADQQVDFNSLSPEEQLAYALVAQGEADALSELGLAQPAEYVNKSASYNDAAISYYNQGYNNIMQAAESQQKQASVVNEAQAFTDAIFESLLPSNRLKIANEWEYAVEQTAGGR